MAASLWSLVRGKSSQDLWDSAKFALIEKVSITQNEIGRGSFGVVYGAVYGGTQCVAKEIHRNLIGEGVNDNTIVESFIKEINILSTLRHPNIVYFFGVHFRKGSHVPVLIIERMWISLAKLLEERSSIPLVIKVHILHDVACGLKFLHNQDPPVMHRDLTANNILINKNMEAKIADLGLATALEAINRQRLSTAPGNLAHMPPEALQSNPVYSTKLDIFSFGCVSLHAITQQFPMPTDQYELSQLNNGTFIKISEYRRRWKYMEIIKDQYTHLVYLISSCIKDEPDYRPDAGQMCQWIEDYWDRPEMKQNCPESLIDYCTQDKISLVTSLEQQTMRAKDMESTVQMYKSQYQELTNSTVTKDERISLLEKQYSDLQRSMESQRVENERLRSQAESFQQDLSQQTDNEIIMSLNTMLQQEQEDMREKQEEIGELRMRLNNLEQASTRMRREGERREEELQEGNAQLQALQKKEAELNENIERIKNEKGSLVREKEHLQREVQDYCTNLQKKDDEIKELKAMLEKIEGNNKSLESKKQKEQAEETNNDEQLNKTSNENVLTHDSDEKLQQTAHNVPPNMNKIQKELEELKLKLKQEAEMHAKLKKEIDQKMEEELKLKLKSQEELLQKKMAEKEEKFQKEAAYWKAKAEHMETSTDERLEAKLLAERKKLEEEKEKLKQQRLGAHQMNTKYLTEFHNSMKEMQAASEIHMQREKQKVEYLEALKQQKNQFAELKQVNANEKSSFKRKLGDKSVQLSLLQSQLNSLQQKLDSKDEEVSVILEEKERIQKLLENMSKMHTSAKQNLETFKEAHRKEAGILQSITMENVNEILQAELLKCQDLITEKEKEITLLNETLQTYLGCHSSDQEKIKKLEKQVKDNSRLQTKQQNQYEAKLKQNSKYIETLEKKSLAEYSSHYSYSITWSPYVPLPVKRIRPSATTVKDKAFVTGGYHQFSPQGQAVEAFLKLLEGKCEVYCFCTGKYQCNGIASPVQLGALASVNGQCVLVSGADSEGNTLTGNVYVLCEEGSHDQWKEFSKPLPTPRILACACCYGNRWLIVCGGFACRPKEESSLLEAVNVVEILDTTKDEWCTLAEKTCPKFSTILCCSVVGEDLYVVGSDQVIKTSCNKLIKAATSNNTLVWDNVEIETEESNGKLYPFSVVEVNGEPMIIASMSDGEDDITCVLMKDTRGRWRIMSKAVECQHCSAAVMTSSLELLLFGGSEKILAEEVTEISQNGTLIPTLDDIYERDDRFVSQNNNNKSGNETVVPNQPANLSFTGPIHTTQFDHNGGTFQSPVHKVSLVVPPNALSDGEKVTVYMGATTSGPFDLPEHCKLRSTVVWLSGSTNVVFKRSVALVIPHSALLTNPEHDASMKFLICEEFEGAKYQLSHSKLKYEIGTEYGLVKLDQLTSLIVAIVTECKPVAINGDIDGHVEENVATIAPTRYLAKLFWPPKFLPGSFRADIFCIQNLPTEMHKVDLLYKKYYKEHGMYPEVLEIEFTMCGSQPLKCVLPCNSSSNCDCFTDWNVTQLTDSIEVSTEDGTTSPYKIDPIKFSFKFNCQRPGACLTCCFELQGAKRGTSSKLEYVPECLKSRFSKLGCFPPILLGSGTSPMQGIVTNGTYLHDGTK